MFFLIRCKPCWDNLWLMLAGWVLFLAQPGIADDSCPVYLVGQKTPYTIVFRSADPDSIHTELRRSGPNARLKAPAGIDDERIALLKCIEEGFDENNHIKDLGISLPPDEFDDEQRASLKKIDIDVKYNGDIKPLWDLNNFIFFRCLSERAKNSYSATGKGKMISSASPVFYDNMIDVVNEGAEQHRKLVFSRFDFYEEEQVLVFTAVSEREWACFPNGDSRYVKETPEAVLYEWELKIDNTGKVIAANLVYPGLANQGLLAYSNDEDDYGCLIGMGAGLAIGQYLFCVGGTSSLCFKSAIFCLGVGLLGRIIGSGNDKTRVIRSINQMSTTPHGAPELDSEQAAIIKKQPFVGTGSDILRRRKSE